MCPYSLRNNRLDFVVLRAHSPPLPARFSSHGGLVLTGSAGRMAALQSSSLTLQVSPLRAGRRFQGSLLACVLYPQENRSYTGPGSQVFRFDPTLFPADVF